MPLDFSKIQQELSIPERREAFRRKWETDMAAKAKNLDFTNVKERNFNIKHLPEGDYPAKVTKVEDAVSSKTKEPMWLFTITITGGGAGAVGTSLPYYCVLNTNNIWKVRSLAIACGVNVPKKRVSLDPNKLIGKALGVTLEDDEYDNKMKSVVGATMPLSEIGDAPDAAPGDEEIEDAEDEAPAEKPKEGKKGKKDKGGKKSKSTVDDLEEIEVEEI